MLDRAGEERLDRVAALVKRHLLEGGGRVEFTGRGVVARRIHDHLGGVLLTPLLQHVRCCVGKLLIPFGLSNAGRNELIAENVFIFLT